jgi:hypothetical protein
MHRTINNRSVCTEGQAQLKHPSCWWASFGWTESRGRVHSTMDCYERLQKDSVASQLGCICSCQRPRVVKLLQGSSYSPTSQAQSTTCDANQRRGCEHGSSAAGPRDRVGVVCECTEPWICEIAQLRCAFISFAMLRVGLVAC